jgi:hypothetical protein
LEEAIASIKNEKHHLESDNPNVIFMFIQNSLDILMNFKVGESKTKESMLHIPSNSNNNFGKDSTENTFQDEDNNGYE